MSLILSDGRHSLLNLLLQQERKRFSVGYLSFFKCCDCKPIGSSLAIWWFPDDVVMHEC
jgi:hypothetical protein